jgi:arylsulfatase A-like enzyme
MRITLTACFVGCLLLLVGAASAAERPNIVVILADDMGYGDPRCFNPQSKISTPCLDRLAAQGMRFTDAHAPGSVCIPSRYGLMTGRYPFRAKSMSADKGVVIEPGRVTIASFLAEQGYATAMVGKWHLGFEGGDQFDYAQPLRGGPADRGFAYFFGQHASLDIPPYFFIENDRCVAPASEHIEANSTSDWSPIQGAFWRAGAVAPGFKHDEVLSAYTRRAIDYVDRRAKATDGKPFFLYLALTAPHTPWLPTGEFRPESGENLYFRWVSQVDEAIGSVLHSLEKAGVADNTLVVFSSDNGPVWLPDDVKRFGHASAGPWRGMKGDSWEAGHRMPFIATWPAKIKPGQTSAETICFTDLFATCAAIVDAKLPNDAGEDSFNFLPALLGEPRSGPLRPTTVIGTGKNVLSIRRGDWKLIPFLGSGGFTQPNRIKPQPGEPTGQLYNLADDPGETKNLFAERPEIAKELAALLAETCEKPRSRPSLP